MQIFIIAMLIAIGVIAVAWYFGDAIAGWRTIVINAISAFVVSVGPDLMGYLVGFDWGGLFNPSTAPGTRAALGMVLATNVINIALRLMTRGPVGEK